MTYEVEVYQSIERSYFAFLRQHSPSGKTGSNLYILQTYSLSDLGQLSKIDSLCRKSKGRPREEVKRRIEEILA